MNSMKNNNFFQDWSELVGGVGGGGGGGGAIVFGLVDRGQWSW